jgi:tripartite-type tricarboxylate transporter receptor subunit TctC
MGIAKFLIFIYICIQSIQFDAAYAQSTYPRKSIRIIVPFPPGGANTTISRIVGEKLTVSWGQQVLIDNRAGGNTIIGTDALVRSPPDGYTLIMVSSAHAINHLLLPNIPYDALKDFSSIATIASTEQLLVTHPSLPVKNLKEFIALAKSKPDQLNYGSSGTGGVQHLAGEFFCILAGIKMRHIPYKGGGPAIVDLIGGHIHSYFSATSVAFPLINDKKIKAIAISGELRMKSMPDILTFSESGLDKFDVKGWFVLLAPANTPREIVDKISSELGKIVNTDDVKEKLISQGQNPFYLNPTQTSEMIKSSINRYSNIIKTANIKLDQF